MKIILEGPDGAGKTTLAMALCSWMTTADAAGNTTSGPVIHHEGPPPTDKRVLEHYGEVFLHCCGSDDVIFDRLAMGELIYGPILRGEDRLGEIGWRVFKRLMAAHNALHVICLPPWEVARENWRKKHNAGTDLVKREEQYAAIYAGYAERLAGSLHYDYTVRSERGMSDHLTALKTVIAQCGMLPSLKPHLIGAPGATNLFVGDRGANPTCTVDLPFFATEGSSLYFHRAIELTGIPERNMIFMNARANDGTHNEIPYVESMSVIALGAQASRVCQRQGVPHKTISHPQWWRRFRYHDINDYARLLRGE